MSPPVRQSVLPPVPRVPATPHLILHGPGRRGSAGDNIMATDWPAVLELRCLVRVGVPGCVGDEDAVVLAKLLETCFCVRGHS